MSECRDIAERVRCELVDHLRALQRDGGRYIAEYVEAYMGPKTTWRPAPAFHPKLAELIRDLTVEVALAHRTCGAARTTSHVVTSDSEMAVVSRRESSRKKVAA